MDKVKIGFVGAGGIGRAHADALAKVPDAQIVGITDVNPAAAEALGSKLGVKAYPSVRELVDRCELDALFILLPPFAHGEAERAALERGLPFFVEKPVGLDLGICREIGEEIERKGTMTSTGYMNRYRKGVQTAKDLLDQESGILAYGGWWSGTPGAGNHWWPDKSKSGGQFHEQVTHTVDLTRYLLGEAEEVFAAGASGFVKGVDGYSLDDALAVTIRFKGGAVASLIASVTSNAGGKVFLDLHSMNRNFKFRDWEHSLSISEKGKETTEIAGEPDIFSVEDAAFVAAIKNNDRSLIRSTYADGLKTTELTLAVNRSLETGAPVALG